MTSGPMAFKRAQRSRSAPNWEVSGPKDDIQKTDAVPSFSFNLLPKKKSGYDLSQDGTDQESDAFDSTLKRKLKQIKHDMTKGRERRPSPDEDNVTPKGYNQFTGDEASSASRHEDDCDSIEDCVALENAALNGHRDTVKVLLKEGKTPGKGLELAAMKGHKEIIKILLDTTADPGNALENAAMNGHNAIVKMLLEKSANPGKGLEKAATNGHKDIVKLLLDQKDADPGKGLEMAAQNGHKDVVKILLERRTDHGKGLERAAENGHKDIVKLLLVRNADIGKGLEYAAMNGHKDIVIILMDRKADSGLGLEMAARGGHFDIVKLLLPEKHTAPGMSLQNAAEKGHEDIVKLLFKKCKYFVQAVLVQSLELAALNGHDDIASMLIKKCKNTGKALENAALNGHKDIVKKVYKKSVDPDKLGKGVENAALRGHTDIVKFLLEKKGNPGKGLENAAMNGHKDIVKLLMESGADIGQSLENAAMSGHKDIVRLLLEKGTDADNALEKAAMNGHKDIVKLLLEKGANTGDGLECAAENGYRDIVKLLLDKKAHLGDGLEKAAMKGHKEIVMLLLGKDADIGMGLENAASHGHTDIVKLLLEKCQDLGKGLENAALNGHGDTVKLLLSKGHHSGMTLENAARNGHRDIVKMILKEEGCEDKIRKAIDEASSNGHTGIVKILFDANRRMHSSGPHVGRNLGVMDNLTKSQSASSDTDSPRSSKRYNRRLSVALPTVWPTAKDCKTDFSVRTCTNADRSSWKHDKFYKMRSTSRGRVLLFNNFVVVDYRVKEDKEWKIKLAQRHGTEQDEQALRCLFKQLHFDVEVKKDRTAKQMRKDMDEEKESSLHWKADCFIIVFLSHGSAEGIFGIDGEILPRDEIHNCFNNKNFKSMNGKPKLFFTQACRGDTYDERDNAADSEADRKGLNDVAQDSLYDHIDIEAQLPSDADMFFANATTKDYVSFRHKIHGSWFIQALVYIFRKYADTEDIASMFTLVNNLVTEGRARSPKGVTSVAVSEYRSTLRKKLHFFPGLTETET